MSTLTSAPPLQGDALGVSIQQQVVAMIDDLFAQLSSPERLTAEQRRGIIARYTAVLEGNFIYWMTATNLAVHADAARPILLENLYEEVRDSHPAMMRRFAIAAHAFPTDKDALAIDSEMTRVRLFLGKLQGVQSLLTMAFFESYIQRFMPYLAALATAQGSNDMEYTDVHGVCDIAHSEGLFRAVVLEMAVNPASPDADLFEGVDLLRTLVQAIIDGPAQKLAA
jgi:Iron-containing redox enzyme